MAIAADVVTVLIVIAGLMIGYKNGFLKMILSFVFLIIAAVIATIAADSLDDFICDRFIMPTVKTELTEYVNTVYDEFVTEKLPFNEFYENYHSGVLTANEINDIINEEVKKFTDSLKNYTDDLNLPFEIKLTNAEIDSVSAIFNADVPEARIGVLDNPTAPAVEFLTENAVRPTVIRILGNIIFSVSFVILAIVFGVIVNSLGIINRLPLLGTVNRLAGAVLGLLVSAMILMILSLILLIFLNQNPDLQTEIDKTYIAKYCIEYLTVTQEGGEII
ncbi:MAG: CvpA family protein [Ruminococcus sp.]|nr:CvpA family protein [Ruminococcus sp.]